APAPARVGSHTDPAVRVTIAGAATISTALPYPTLFRSPTLVFPPATPLTCQVTALLAVLVTVAVKVCVPPVWTLAAAGATDTVTDRGGAGMNSCDAPMRYGVATVNAVTVTIAEDATVAG